MNDIYENINNRERGFLMQKPKEKVIILDFKSRFAQLIARRVRKSQVFCEILPYDTSLEKILKEDPKAIILSGGDFSIFDETITCDRRLFNVNIPILAIGYGMSVMCHVLGGKLVRREKSSKKDKLILKKDDKLFDDIGETFEVSSLCEDEIKTLPEGFDVLAEGETSNAVISNDNNFYGICFHPEVDNTQIGQKIVENFLFKVAGCSGTWSMENFVKDEIDLIRKKASGKKVICALSGGVDSSVAALLTHKAVGDNLTCIFVDHGLLRKNEAENVIKVFRDKFHMNLVFVDAKRRFLEKLKGVKDPELKRKIIGEEFIRVFEDEAAKLGKVDFLVQGTVYPDVIESGTKASEVIKSHHNVGGLPQDVEFKLIEPLRDLFKDEVRKIGEILGMPNEIIYRQPFPGPGLAIRILGEVTQDKISILQEADFIVTEEIKKAGLYRDIWQAFAILPDIRSVGVKDGQRTYTHTVAIRAVESVDGMTAKWVRLPYDVLQKISERIVREVKQVNRVVYDITSKPPATIEWE